MSIKKTTILNVFLLVSIQFLQSQETSVSNKLEKKDTSKMSNISIRIVYDSLIPILDQNKEKVGSYYFKSRDIADVRVICKLNNGLEIEIKNPYSNFIFSDGVLFNYGDTYGACVAGGSLNLRIINGKTGAIHELKKLNYNRPYVTTDDYGNLYFLAYHNDGTGYRIVKINGHNKKIEFEKPIFKSDNETKSEDIFIIFSIKVYKEDIYIAYNNNSSEYYLEKLDKKFDQVFKKKLQYSIRDFSVIDSNVILIEGGFLYFFNVSKSDISQYYQYSNYFFREIINTNETKNVILSLKNDSCNSFRIYTYYNKNRKIGFQEIKVDSVDCYTNWTFYLENEKLIFLNLNNKK